MLGVASAQGLQLATSPVVDDGECRLSPTRETYASDAVSERAYILFWDTSRVGDEEVTARLVPFPGSGRVVSWKLTTPVEVPERIYFEAEPGTCRAVDYPDNDVSWPIMSERMRSILLPDAPKHRTVPVTMLDFYVPTAERLIRGEPAPGVAIEGFAAVQLLEATDAMDMERSIYETDEDLPGLVCRIARLVLKDVPLPSIFRLSVYPGALLVSAEARARLEAAGATGISYGSTANWLL